MQKTVLIVEDDYVIAMDLQLRLEDWGWRVIGPAANVEEALRLLDDEMPLVALLDVNLGDELVTPVAQRLKAEGVPFAVASAHAKPEHYGGPILAGIPNAGKPISDGKLMATLEQLVHGDVC
jgi:DNA-binding response OmpR family regulator